MNTFDEAVAAARAAKETIERREGSKRATEAALSEARKDFAEREAELLENLDADTKAIEVARLELQAALQRQNDAPIAQPEATEAGTLDALTADQAAANAFASAATAFASAPTPLSDEAGEAALRFTA